MTHDCAHQGHVWIEGAHENARPFQRHRGRPKGKLVNVRCQHCKKRAKLDGHGAFTSPPGPHSVDHTIPAPFKRVLDRAVAEAAKNANVGPVEKGA